MKPTVKRRVMADKEKAARLGTSEGASFTRKNDE
jgi:hypothetical protein